MINILLDIRKVILYTIIFVGCACGGKVMADNTKEKLVEYLSDLVSINTLSSDKAANKKALQWVEEQLKGLPLHFQHHEYEGVPSLVISTRTAKKNKLWLLAHMDVVSGEEKLFHPVLNGNKLYGRGVYDMKMAIACYILLMHDLKDKLKDLDVGIILTSDEEVGGMHGVKSILNDGYSSEMALLPDGGFDWNMEEAAKGILQLKITAKGKPAHGSRPWLGENAITKLMNVLREIESYFADEKHNFGDYYPTVNVGNISGGKSTNQVPDFAEAKLDIRYPPELTPEKIKTAISKIVSQQSDVSMETIIEGSSHKQDLKLEAFDKFKTIARELYGINVGSTKAHGASDARYLAEKNIPVLVIAPKGGDIHADGEWIDVNDLERFYNVMKAWVLNVSAR